MYSKTTNNGLLIDVTLPHGLTWWNPKLIASGYEYDTTVNFFSMHADSSIRSGAVFVAYDGSDSFRHFVVSEDHGVAWSNPIVASTNTVHSGAAAFCGNSQSPLLFIFNFHSHSHEVQFRYYNVSSGQWKEEEAPFKDLRPSHKEPVQLSCSSSLKKIALAAMIYAETSISYVSSNDFILP